MVLDGDIAPWTNRLATSASDTFILDMEQMRFPFLGFRIGAPWTMLRTPLKENDGPDARAVVNGEPFDLHD